MEVWVGEHYSHFLNSCSAVHRPERRERERSMFSGGVIREREYGLYGSVCTLLNWAMSQKVLLMAAMKEILYLSPVYNPFPLKNVSLWDPSSHEDPSKPNPASKACRSSAHLCLTTLLSPAKS